jgi:hypothetical protein
VKEEIDERERQTESRRRRKINFNKDNRKNLSVSTIFEY